MSAQLDDEIDRLYAGPLDQFVTERNALSRRLKGAGAGTEAGEVAGLRKPTVVAWTVNQLARKNRRDVDLLLDAGKRIVDAQQASISSGGRAGIDAARASLRKAVADLTASAQRILGDGASQTTLTRVAETLRSAATEAKGRELLARGQLTAELSDTGWETVAAFAPTDSRKRGTRTETKRTETKQQRVQGLLKSAREAVRQEQAARSAATTRVHGAKREMERLRDRLEAAEAAVKEAEAELAAVEQRLNDAETQVRELTDR